MTAETMPEPSPAAVGPINVVVVAEEKVTEPQPTSEDEKTMDLAAAAEEEDKNEKKPARPSTSSPVEKNGSFREESNYLSDLKDHEKKALVDLRAKVEEAIVENKIFKEEPKTEEQKEKEGEGEEPKLEADAEPKAEEIVEKEVSLWGVPLLPSKGSESIDVVLLKFLRAREFKVKEAFEMLQGAIRWRREAKIDSLLNEESLGGDLGAACYMDGVDREGHPVCYNVYGVFDDESLYLKTFGTEEKRAEFLRWRVQLMEKGIQKLDFRPGGVSSLLQITDLKNSPGLTKKELRATMKQAVQLLQDNYPEFVARNIFVNVPFWYYALQAVLSPFLTQRTKSKFVLARPWKVTETLLKYIPAENIPVSYGGFKREKDTEFSLDDGIVSELTVKAGSTVTIELPAPEIGITLLWDLTVLGWEVNYKEEFTPTDEGSYTIIIQKAKKMSPHEEPVRNSFRTNEPGKVVLIIENTSFKKKKVLYRYKTKSCLLKS